MLISINETYNILEENKKVLSTKDIVNTQNRILYKPHSLLIQDSYNNPFFPIRPRPRIDTSKFDLLEVYKRYRELYSEVTTNFLPWHYCVEMVHDRYMIFNTRPVDLRFPINNQEALKNKSIYNIDWDEETTNYFKNNNFDIAESVHILIVGDSNLDVYTLNTYKLIGQICITPILRRYKLPGELYARVFPLNMGVKFKFFQLSKFTRK